MSEDIRLKHAIMDYENEIKWCKEVLVNSTGKDDLSSTQERLDTAEKELKKLLEIANQDL